MRGQRRSWVGALAVAASVATTGLACSSPAHPGYLVDPSWGDAAAPADAVDPSFDVAVDTAPLNCSAVEAGLLCACREIGTRPPVLYVLLDRSGSMLESPGSSGLTKWNLVRTALVDPSSGALRKLGSKIRIGLAIFPGNDTDACSTEIEGFPITRGSTAAYDALNGQLQRIAPGGGTPTAISLTALGQRLAGVEGPVYVLLATDGGPNCNATLTCTPDSCIQCIEHASIFDATTGKPTGLYCDANHNCCDPSLFGAGANEDCLDSANTNAAAAALAAAGMKTFVVGVPGAGPYAAALDALAAAGGTDHYYDATDPTQAALEAALEAITAKAIDSCNITLESPPTDPGMTNVIVDGVTIPQDPTNGWSWGPGYASIVLNGAACTTAKDATDIQVAVGCKTVTPQ